ncbi:MAG: 2-polyprenylphenol 6-hydroxylase [Deltaproteobacteria bacterium]|nr:2-polyprenylphenol 6-hydroxylase [Deltaproteobacteria bacterium]
MAFTTVRNIIRLNQIARVLVKYGFGGLVAELGLAPVASFIGRITGIGIAAHRMPVPERVRKVLEELGPTFVKLGQVASTRADVLPPEWIEELKKLQDSVPPVSYAEAKKVVERAFRAPINEVYRSFDEVPVASASIAQVHYAVLNDSTEVAVKVKRPGIEKVVDADISVMYTVARLLKKHVSGAKRYRPIEIIDEFARVIHNELDLSIEGANATTFTRIFKDDTTVKVPEIHWSRTNTDVLTMERISGLPLDEIEKIKAMGLDVPTIANNGLRAFFKQVFDHGVFHADLHPGNIFIDKKGTIIYLDFGIVGRLDRELRYYLANMLFCLMKKDYRRMALIHREMGLIERDVDIHEFEHALMDLSEPVFGRSLQDIDISSLLMKLIHTARRFRMKLQPNLLLLQKSMVIIEGVGRQIYPDINVWEVAKPMIYRWVIKEKFSPFVHAERGREFAGEMSATLFDLPGQFHSLLSAAMKDDLKVGFVHHRLEEMTAGVRSVGRMAGGGMLAGALSIGGTLAMLFSPSGVKTLFGLPLLGWALFAAAAFTVAMTMRADKRPADNDED